jgi:hypothetical protein
MVQMANPKASPSLPSMANSTSAANTNSTGHAPFGWGLLLRPPFLVVVVPPLGLRPLVVVAGVVLVVDRELV